MAAGSQGNYSTHLSHNEPNPIENRTLLPTDERLTQPGLEVAPADEHHKQFVNHVDQGDKEVVRHDDKEVLECDRKEPVFSTDWPGSPSKERTRSRKLCGMKRSIFWALLIAALVVFALGVGLGVGLSLSNSDEPSTSATSPAPPSSPSTSTTSTLTPSSTPVASDLLKVGGSLDPDFYSTSGAWNGSGVAWIWQNFAQDWEDTPTLNEHSIVIYYQHYSGEVRWLRQTTNEGVWRPGPSDLVVVGSNARNSTPIAAVHYDDLNQTNYWNVFYIDSKNQIRQRSGNNGTESPGWTEGSIRKANLTVWNGDLVGLSACWSSINTSVPIRLFYASDNTTFQEYLWWTERDEWVWQRSWEDFNGAAGVGCYNGDGGDYTYIGLLKPNNELQFWFQRKTGDDSADWRQAPAVIQDVHPGSSIALTNNLAVMQQNSTNNIMVRGMIWNATDTRVADDFSPGPEYAGVPGTRIDVSTLGTGQVSSVWIFYQHDGNDVRWLYRELGNNDVWQWRTAV